MMMLGLVLHTCITYTVTVVGGAWPIKDPTTTHLSMDWLVFTIHIFRMPIFFVVSGFFGALLFYERSAWRMIRNRLSRVLLPFMVFLLLLYPIAILGFGYTTLAFAEKINTATSMEGIAFHWKLLLPASTIHLWFLYYLMLLSATFCGLGVVMKKQLGLRLKIHRVFRYVLQRPLSKIVFFPILTWSCLALINETWVLTSIGFVPDIETFGFYFVFYGFGWVLFKNKELLPTFKKVDWFFTILGLLTITLNLALTPHVSNATIMLFNSASVWFLVFGIIGLFVRYANRGASFWRYISDASYWVYQVHFPWVALLPGIAANWECSVWGKVVFVLGTSTALCFLSYALFVRSTFIGAFLNGRRYPRKT